MSGELPEYFPTVESFQAATAGGRDHALVLLDVDGVLGPATRRALDQLPYLSPHFQWWELRSGTSGPCLVRRELLLALETLRASVGAALSIVSGYRSPARNKAVGGAKNSQHLRGLAADIPVGYVTEQRARTLGLFSGIGRVKYDGAWWATHVDLRHLEDQSLTPERPTRWTY